MEIKYSILLYQVRGQVVDWYTEAYHGPFTSPEERESWMNDPENKIERRGARYKVEFLSK